MNTNINTSRTSKSSKTRNRLLSTIGPMLVLALPGMAQAQTAVNTARVTAPAGSFEINSANNEATDTDTILAVMVAGNDNVTNINGMSGAIAVLNAFTADTVNGVAATSSNSTLSVAAGSSVPAGLTFNTATGNVDVAAGTRAGTYSFDYTICETANPSNCKTATISVTVVAAPIVADPDTVAGVNGATGAPNILNVLDGDILNGVPATLANVDLNVVTPATPVGVGAPVPVLDVATGLISVPAGTPAGTYTIGYRVCEELNPTNCATNTATITVAAAPIVAANDSAANINGLAGATAVVNAFTSDTVNGAAASPSNATITVAAGSTVPAGLTFNTASGNVDVATGTRAGVYSFDYTICETLNPSNCKTATISVTVVAAPIIADPDTASGINGANGAPDILNVIDGDTLNGTPVTLTTVDLSVLTPATPVRPGAPVPALDVTTGTVSVPVGTPAGTYTIAYRVCEKLNPTNCATNTATITVEAAPIVATNDSANNINGLVGATAVINAFTSDMINGVAASPSNAVLSVAAGSTVPTGLAFNTATGNVDVAAGTRAGTYSFDYTICEALNPTNCKTATITVTVVAAAIAADPDAILGQNGAIGAIDVLNVLDGDTLNSLPVSTSNIDITVTTAATPARPGASVPVLNTSTGLISIPAGTPAGTYTINYRICEELNAANCADNVATVTVNPSFDLQIAKTNNTTSVYSGAITTYLLTVSNNGPDSATGALVTDVPGAGLTCAAGNIVTISGAGAPSGSYTVGDLIGGGIRLGTIANGQNVTLTYSCRVN